LTSVRAAENRRDYSFFHSYSSFQLVLGFSFFNSINILCFAHTHSLFMSMLTATTPADSRRIGQPRVGRLFSLTRVYFRFILTNQHACMQAGLLRGNSTAALNRWAVSVSFFHLFLCLNFLLGFHV
jgi:hypothetical protein